MALEILPTRTGGAAENMAVDFLLLQRYPRPTAPRFRHYEWRAPAFTFGYSQKIAFVREQLAALQGEGHLDLCRRPTGGGLVDHRDDWTYALVIPRGHPLEELRAAESYRAIHEALAATLRTQGVEAVTQQTSAAEEGGAGVCFARAEIHDVVHAPSGTKIAGAAQKRNKHGLLFQGSIARRAAGGAAVNWDKFESDFLARLGSALALSPETTPWPEIDDDEVCGLTEQYASPEWIEYR